jgi:hypothetical protein
MDFPNLAGPAPAPNSNLINTGRTQGTQGLTEGGKSRYTDETVRINLDVARRAAGRILAFPPRRTQNPLYTSIFIDLTV